MLNIKIMKIAKTDSLKKTHASIFNKKGNDKTITLVSGFLQIFKSIFSLKTNIPNFLTLYLYTNMCRCNLSGILGL